ncbi:hypothetical protein ACLD9V_03505 [Streptomyces lincolnensis]
MHDYDEVRLGVDGTPVSVERAGHLGLPMTLGLIGENIRRARALAENYRAAGSDSRLHPSPPACASTQTPTTGSPSYNCPHMT